jgi:hypothetical protein
MRLYHKQYKFYTDFILTPVKIIVNGFRLDFTVTWQAVEKTGLIFSR